MDILICSQQVELYFLLRCILAENGFSLRLATCHSDAIEICRRQDAEAVIIDCEAWPSGAIDLCMRLKDLPDTSRIAVAALISGDVKDRHRGLLLAGVDEVLMRPLDPLRLLQFLQSPDRFSNPSNREPDRPQTAVEKELMLETDDQLRYITVGDQRIRLGPIEYRLFICLYGCRGKVCDRQQLIAAAWNDTSHVDGRTVDVHVARLRKRLRDRLPRLSIRAVYGSGYVIEIVKQD
jgi:two-component system phosphate regulon response regulator PhoB